MPLAATSGREETAGPTTLTGQTQYRELQILATYVEGEVEWKLGEWEWRDLEIGTQLPSGAEVRVSEGGFAELVVGGRAQILLTEETAVSIDALLADAARVEIGLSSGSVAARVGRLGLADSLDVSTPTVSTGVRGTEFSVSYTGDDTTVAVREGVVVLKPAGIEDALARLQASGYDAINQVLDSLPSLSSGQESTIGSAAIAALAETIETTAEELTATASAVDSHSRTGVSAAVSDLAESIRALDTALSVYTVTLSTESRRLFIDSLDKADQLERELPLDADWVESTSMQRPAAGTEAATASPPTAPEAEAVATDGTTTAETTTEEAPPPSVSAPVGVAVETQEPIDERPALVVEGTGDDRFFAAGGDQRVVVQGVTYNRIVFEAPEGQFDAVLRGFDAPMVADEFARLSGMGYNVVEVDLPSSGPGNIGLHGGAGLSNSMVESLAELIGIAAGAGLRVVIAAEDIPADGEYRTPVDEAAGPDFAAGRNALLLTAAGHDAARRFWGDLAGRLVRFGAPIEAVAAFVVLDEAYVFESMPPFDRARTVAGAGGRRYSLPDERDRLLDESISGYIELCARAIHQYLPHALIGVGTRAPNDHTRSEGMLFRYESVLASAGLDFLQLNVQPFDDYSPRRVTDAVAIIREMRPVPIVLNQMDLLHFSHPYEECAAEGFATWYYELDRALALDGWIYHYSSRPELPDGAPDADAAWGLLEGDAGLAGLLAGIGLPPEVVGRDLTVSAPYLNLARAASIRVSNSVGEWIPVHAVDGDPEAPWIGGEPPQTITIEFDGPQVIRKVCLRVYQEVPGRSVHRLEMRFGQQWREIHIFEGVTRRGDQLVLDPERPWEDVSAVRIITDVAPSATGWLEVGIYAP